MAIVLKLKTHLFNIAYATYPRLIPAPTNNILVTYGALQVLYCIVLYSAWWSEKNGKIMLEQW